MSMKLVRPAADSTVWTCATQVDQVAADDAEIEVAARAAIDAMDDEAIRAGCIEYVSTIVRERRRNAALRAERRAFQSSLSRNATDGPRPRKGTHAYREWLAASERNQAYEEEREAAKSRTAGDYLKQMWGVVDEFVSDLRAEWTRDLLDTPFHLVDGTAVTWGEATVEQHQARADMFVEHAQANVEGAARHQKAIADMNAAGVPTLNALATLAVSA